MSKLLRIGGDMYPWKKILAVAKDSERGVDRETFKIKVMAEGLNESWYTFPDKKSRDAYFEKIIEQRDGGMPQRGLADPLPINRAAIKEALQVTIAMYVAMDSKSPNLAKMKELYEAMK